MESTRTDFIHFAKVASTGFLGGKFEEEEDAAGGWMAQVAPGNYWGGILSFLSAILAKNLGLNTNLEIIIILIRQVN